MGPTKGVRSGGSACGPRPDATFNRSAGDPERPLSGQRAGRFNHHISPTPAAPPQLRAPAASHLLAPAAAEAASRGSGGGSGGRLAAPGSGGGSSAAPGTSGEISAAPDSSDGSSAAPEAAAPPPPPGALLRIPKEGSAATGSGKGSSAAAGSDGRVTHRTSPARKRLSQGCCHSPVLS